MRWRIRFRREGQGEVGSRTYPNLTIVHITAQAWCNANGKAAEVQERHSGKVRFRYWWDEAGIQCVRY